MLRGWWAGIALAGAALLGPPGCAAPPAGPSILASDSPAAERTPPAPEPQGPVALAFRGPEAGGTAYRLLLEVSGEREVSVSTDLESRPPLHESHLLELEYRELPIESARGREDAYLLALDGLHYKLAQGNPTAEREIELGSDRLRVFADRKQQLDLRGSQPKGDLTPRKLLDRVFAVVVHDPAGNPVSIRSQGVPVARRFLGPLLVKPAVAYSRLPLPEQAIAPGSVWRAERFPASPAGAIGLRLEVEYTLAGFQELDGVPCAWILLRADDSREHVPSAAGFRFDRVVASLTGTAWVELASSRLRRLVLEDEIRATYTRGADPAPVFHHRLRHRSRLLLELRDPAAEPGAWADGSERFGRR